MRSTERRSLAKTIVERCVADQVGEEPVDRRPDRLLGQRAELLDGAEDAQVEVLAQPAVDDRDRAMRVSLLVRARPPR